MSKRQALTAFLLTVLMSTSVIAQFASADAINWKSDLDSAKIEASRTGKLILLHFWTKSCGPCKKLERDVFSQPQLGEALHRDFIPVKIDADLSPALANLYQISRVPSEVVLTAQGNVVTKLSCPLEPAPYAAQLAGVAQNFRSTVAKASHETPTQVNSAYAGLQIGQPQAPSAAPAAARPSAPPAPSVIQNPYYTASSQPAPNSAPTQQASTQTVAPAQPAVPANAMPNSYRDRYAAAAPPVLAKQEVPVSQPVAAAPAYTQAQPPTAAPVKQATAPASAPVVAQAKPAWPPQLPPNTPPLAFDGYCPVSLKTAKKWVQGNQQFGAIHRGRTYLFTSDSQRQQFLANPDAFSPVFAGKDPVLMLDENKSVDGTRKYGFEYRGAFYLFSSKASMARFESQPDRYAAGVRQAMSRIDASAGGTLRR